MRTLLLTLLLLSVGMTLRAQIRQFEYGWDTDKGHGLNTMVSVSKAGNDADVDLNIPMQGLTNGYHQLFVRTRDAKGLWSHTYLRLVNVLAGSVPAKIVKLDYTYSLGGTQVGQYSYKIPTPATSVQLTVPGDVSSLKAGQGYTLSIWATDENGTRSQVYQTTFTYRVVDCKGLAINAPTTGVFCKNGSTILAATIAGGNTPITYSWSRVGTEVGKASSLTVAQSGTYSVKATDALGCVSTATVDVSEAPSPVVAVTPATAAFCAGQSTSLTASASGGTGPYTYQWKQGTANAGSTVATLSVNTGGVYSVAATDANGCTSTTAAATVTQRPIPTATATASAPGFTTGGNVTLTANTGTGLTYQWIRDGQSIAGATQVTYTAQQPGSYAVVVSNGECSATSPALTISLITALEEPQPDTDFMVSASPNPGQGVVEVQLTSQRGKTILVTLTVRDLTGRSLYEKPIKVTGQHTESLDLTKQPTGLYLLKAATDKQERVLRLIRE